MLVSHPLIMRSQPRPQATPPDQHLNEGGLTSEARRACVVPSLPIVTYWADGSDAVANRTELGERRQSYFVALRWECSGLCNVEKITTKIKLFAV